MISGEDSNPEELRKEDGISPVGGESSSGYHTTIGTEGNGSVEKSDTMEDIDPANWEVVLDSEKDEKEDSFKSVKIEPEEEEENPFADVHLKPQLQLSSTAASVPSRGSKNMIPEETDDFLDITVTDPTKVGDGMGSYVMYTVKTKTNINYFKGKNMAVKRRFSDFLGLHDKLSEKYLPNGRIIPPAPDKNMVGMAKVKLTKEGDEASNDEFVEKRRVCLERYLNRTASHPSLRTDPDFREFLEYESDLPRSNQTSALSGKSVMKLINKVGDKVSNLTLKMDETDEWFAEKTMTIDALDTQFKKLHASTASLVEFRRHLSYCTGSLSKSLEGLSTVEENSKLSGAISRLAIVEWKIDGIHREQSEADLYDLSELIKDYIGLIGAVKESFGERVKAWQNWQNITSNLNKKRESKVRAELQQKTEKIGLLRQEIAEYERQQEMAQENFEKISRIIKKEVDFFDTQRANDFKKTIIRYLEKMMRSQENIAEEWEKYLPHVQQIDV